MKEALVGHEQFLDPFCIFWQQLLRKGNRRSLFKATAYPKPINFSFELAN